MINILTIITCVILIIIVVCNRGHTEEEMEFGMWDGTFTDQGQKIITTDSASGDYILSVYIDKDDIFRLKFYPERELSLVVFDSKQYKGMNFNSLYGYDHWIRRMKKHYVLKVWFEDDTRRETFSLKGFSQGVNWLYE